VKSPSSTISGESRKAADGDKSRQLHKITFNKKTIYFFKACNMRMLKAYKYRIYPTKDQKELIKVIIGACRFVYNWALEQKIKTYEQYKKSISRFDLQRILVHEVKPANEWLKKANSQALLASLVNVESAFTRFFREKKGFPKFKSKKNPVQSYQLPQHYTVDFEKSIVRLPKIGEVKAILHRQFEGTLKTATNSNHFKNLHWKILYQYSCGRWKRTSCKTGILRIYYSGNRCRN